MNIKGYFKNRDLDTPCFEKTTKRKGFIKRQSGQTCLVLWQGDLKLSWALTVELITLEIVG